MRVLAALAALLLAAAAFYWSLEVQGASPPVMPVEVVADGFAETGPGLGDPLNGPNDPTRTEASARVRAAPLDRKGQLRVIIRAQAEWALEPPRLFSLTMRQARERSQQSSRRAPKRGDLMLWEAASSVGSEIRGVSTWSQISEDDPDVHCWTWIDPPKRGSQIFAKLGDRIAKATVRSPGMTSVEIDMRYPAERFYRAQVLHFDGRPAEGVPIVAVPSKKQLRLTGGAADESRVALDGRAVYTDAGGWVELPLTSGNVPAAWVFGESPIPMSSDGRNQIVLPPVGAIEASLPLDQRNRRLWVSFAKVHPHVDLKRDAARVPCHDAMSTAFPVALGHRFRVSLETYGHRARLEVDGPTSAGEVIQVELTPTRSLAIEATLTDESGAPLAGGQALLKADEHQRLEWRSRTSAKGHARFSRLKYLPDDPLGRVMIAVLIDDQRGRISYAGEVDAPAPDDKGVIDLGAVTLHEIPLLVAGRVVDEEGEPIPKAAVDIFIDGQAQGRNSISTSRLEWPGSRAGLFQRTNADGLFAIHFSGDATEGGRRELTVRAEKAGRPDMAPYSFAPGARDVELVLETSGKIQVDATALVPEEMKGITLTLEPARTGARATEIKPGRRTIVEGQAPGPHALVIKMPPETTTVADDLIVKPGETLVHPILNPLRLDGFIQWRNLYVTGPDGAPVPEITVGCLRANEPDRVTTVQDREGSFQVAAYLNEAPDGYWIQAPGCRRKELSRLDQGMRIQLDQALNVTLQLEGAALPGQPFSLYVTAQGASASSGSRNQVSFDATGRGTFAAPSAGSFVLAGIEGVKRWENSPTASRPWWGAAFTVADRGAILVIRAVDLK